MKIRFLLSLGVLLLTAVAANASTGTAVQYSYAQISVANTTVDLVPFTFAAGTLNGIKCIFPSSAAGSATLKVTIGLDSDFSNLNLDPTHFEQESSGAGQLLSGWIPFSGSFTSSIHVTLNNSSLGTATINCWAAWTTN
jgi:hypothetical protein